MTPGDGGKGPFLHPGDGGKGSFCGGGTSQSASFLCDGWKRNFDHPTTFLYAKNSWKLQKRFSRRKQVFAKNYITTSRGADGCDVATMLDIKFYRNPALKFPTKNSYINFCDAF